MKIGILTFHWVYNFGANLQAYSTYCNIYKRGHEPIIINWIPEDDELVQNHQAKPVQIVQHKTFNGLMQSTNLCRNEREIACEIKRLDIEAIIVGSDAVWNIAKPRFSRSTLKKIMPLSDHCFPNPFFGSFQKYLDHSIPMAALSVSMQNADYIKFAKEKREICAALDCFTKVYVRDMWAQKAISFFSSSKIVPVISPDPVFAFNDGVINIPSRKELCQKYEIPEDYVLMSFSKNPLSCKRFNDNWLCNLVVAFEAAGFNVVNLEKIVDNLSIKSKYKVEGGINPIDWYSLIRYSKGYIGVLMHPIIVSLHNNVPFFSFDTYGLTNFYGHLRKESSKIFHIVGSAGLLDNYHSCSIYKSLPDPHYVVDKIVNFDMAKEKIFLQEKSRQFAAMMDDILESFEKVRSK